MTTKTSPRGSVRLLPVKTPGPGGTPSATPAGLALPRPPRRLNHKPPAVRPPSLSRFPGLLQPQACLDLGGSAL
jgi:hypothetical protein